VVVRVDSPREGRSLEGFVGWAMESRASACLGAGASADGNLRYRAQMEDRHVVKETFAGSNQQAFFAVYDGHGGKEAADFAAESLHVHLERELGNPANGTMEESLTNAFLATDLEISKAGIHKSGATAVAAFVKCGEGGTRTLYAANAGDARAVLCRGSSKDQSCVPEVKRLSFDHKPTVASEQERIEAAGGLVIRSRVMAVLAVSRALGDHELKKLVVAQPHVSETHIVGSEDAILILACDGVFDVMTDEQVAEWVWREHGELKMKGQRTSSSEDAAVLAQALVNEALRRGTTDNVTAVVVLL